MIKLAHLLRIIESQKRGLSVSKSRLPYRDGPYYFECNFGYKCINILHKIIDEIIIYCTNTILTGKLAHYASYKTVPYHTQFTPVYQFSCTLNPLKHTTMYMRMATLVINNITWLQDYMNMYL